MAWRRGVWFWFALSFTVKLMSYKQLRFLYAVTYAQVKEYINHRHEKNDREALTQDHTISCFA